MLIFPQSLELDIDGVPVVRLAFGITLYMAEPFSAMAEETLAAFNLYKNMMGEDRLRFYATDTMNKHRKVTPRALSMLSTWLADDAPPRETFGIEFNDAEVYNGISQSRFMISGDEEVVPGERSWASIVHWSMDPSWGEERPEELLNLAKELCTLFPFRCGHGGYILHRSRYFPEKASDHAWAKAMHHPGLDLPDAVRDGRTVGFDGVRTVGWLTMLDDAFAKMVGAANTWSLCERIKVDGGLIIKAGPKPAIGDVDRGDNMPAYREAFRLVEPLTRKAFERAPHLGLSGPDNGRTLVFLRRLAEGE
jgi:hypothetical protein